MILGLGSWQGLPRQQQPFQGFPSQHSFLWPVQERTGWGSIGHPGTNPPRPQVPVPFPTPAIKEKEDVSLPPWEISGWPTAECSQSDFKVPLDVELLCLRENTAFNLIIKYSQIALLNSHTNLYSHL